MAELTIQASLEHLEQVIAFVDAQLEQLDCPMKTQMQIDVAVEEIFVNISHYAYAPGTGEAVIRLDFDPDTRTCVIVFQDSGVPFDPTAKEDPDVTLSAEQRKVGGLGIFMVKKSMDEMHYRREDGKNVLKLKKRLA